MVYTCAAPQLPRIRDTDAQGHVALKHGGHQQDVRKGRIVNAFDPQIHRLRVADPFNAEHRQRQLALHGIYGVRHDLRRLLVPQAHLALHQHRCVHRQIAPASFQHLAEAQQLHGGRFVLQHHIRHQRAVLRRPRPHRGHDAGHRHHLSVRILSGGTVLQQRRARQHISDGHSAAALGRVPIVHHGMAGQIQPRRLALHAHPLCGGELRQIGHHHLLHRVLVGAHAEEVDLPLHIPPPHVADGIHYLLVYSQHL